MAHLLTDRKIERALAYNNRHAPLSLLDQTTFRMVVPRSLQGVLWVARMQAALDDDDPTSELPRLAIDGALGPATTAALELRYGLLDLERHSLHPSPLYIARWGYDHAHDADVDDPDSREWRQRSPAYEAYTSHGRWRDGMLRLVAGYSHGARRWNRTPASYVSLDNGSFGIAHYPGRRAAPLISATARALPCQAREAWGDCRALIVMDESRLAELLGWRTGEHAHRAEIGWLVAGWRRIARQPAAMAIQANAWLRDKADEGRRFAFQQGWRRELGGRDGGRILAACTRMCNSGWGKAAGYVDTARALLETDDPMRLLEAAFRTPRADGGYGKPHRWAKIIGWREFRGPAPTEDEVLAAAA